MVGRQMLSMRLAPHGNSAFSMRAKTNAMEVPFGSIMGGQNKNTEKSGDFNTSDDSSDALKESDIDSDSQKIVEEDEHNSMFDSHR